MVVQLAKEECHICPSVNKIEDEDQSLHKAITQKRIQVFLDNQYMRLRMRTILATHFSKKEQIQ